MNELNIQLYSLIGLRALAEFDSTEYRRATDISKRDLEMKINELLKLSEESDARTKYDELKNIEYTAESNSELNFLLKQIYSYCFQKAQHLSLRFTRDNPDKNINSFQQKEYFKEGNLTSRKIVRENEFLKLGVMRLLQIIDGYDPQFEYKWKNHRIDCILNPIREGLPLIVIETKLDLRSSTRISMAINQLKSYLRFWGNKSIGVLLTSPMPEIQNKIRDIQADNIFLLMYDVEKNDFVGEDIYKLQKNIIM